jgi:SAM-dependent methyltransferase
MRPTAGIPDRASVQALTEGKLFRELEAYSDAFLTRYRDALGSHARRWVSDPFHQWNRRWEYPFVFTRVKEHVDAIDEPRIVDAGSGITFFPFYLARTLGAQVVCVDAAPTLEGIYAKISASEDLPVSFHRADIRATSLPGASFDALYCVSVLEHTRNYGEIIEEFRRLLVPGGSAAITFDVAPDGDADISPTRSTQLLRWLHAAFGTSEPEPGDVAACMRNPHTWTTLTAAQIDPKQLPWTHPLVCVYRALRRGRLPARLGFTNLAVYCNSYRNDGGEIGDHGR